MHGLGSVSDDIPRDAKEVKMTLDFAKALQIHMCRGSCSLFSTQIEDWIGVDKPVNIPGTNTEYPNWRRKLTADLEFIFDMDHVKTMTKEMTDARNK
ncbi:MAG: 4-alpha-glucanotransferase [Succinivibrio sp.]|nr:4-alpha-glucanotransferase [Succinivibrio sp.]